MSTCETCCYWDDGTCKRFPEHRDMYLDDWCGEYRAGYQCVQCGHRSVHKRADALYCSDACRQKAYRERKP